MIHIDRYTPDFDRDAVREALRVGGYPGFIPALRKAPDVGYVQVGSRKVTIRWTQETRSETGRTIVVVTDKPVAFLKAADDTKSRAGYLVALIRLTVDAQGKRQRNDGSRGQGQNRAARPASRWTILPATRRWCYQVSHASRRPPIRETHVRLTTITEDRT